MNKRMQKTRICVIGAGAAGICAARRLHEDAADNGILAQLEIRVFEQSNGLGGTWVLDESFPPPALDGTTTMASSTPHSSMYADLRTNFPRELMQFRNFPFLSESPTESSFPGSAKVLEYLREFAQPIVHLIQFNCRVFSVRPIESSGGSNLDGITLPQAKWEIIIQQRSSSDAMPANAAAVFVEHFDAVFVGIGHYSMPWLPPFAAKLRTLAWLHSHWYRRAEHFAGKHVAVVGAGISGTDIAQQLAKQAEKVYVLHMPAASTAPPPLLPSELNATDNDCAPSHNNNNNNNNSINSTNIDGTNQCGAISIDGCDAKRVLPSSLPSYQSSYSYWNDAERPANCVEVCRPVDANESSLLLADGIRVKCKKEENGIGTDNNSSNIFVDFVIFCTGYRYSFPFLEATGLISCADDGAFVSPMWAHCVHSGYPRQLFLLGLPYMVVPFPLFDRQIQLSLALFYGRVECPSEKVMLEWQEQRMKELEKQKRPSKHFHQMASVNEFYAYMDWLDTVSGRPEWKFPSVLREIHKHVYERRKHVRYGDANRMVRYVVINEREFDVLELAADAKMVPPAPVHLTMVENANN